MDGPVRLGDGDVEILVGGLEHGWIMMFHSVGNVIVSTDELIFFRGVETTYLYLIKTYQDLYPTISELGLSQPVPGMVCHSKMHGQPWRNGKARLQGPKSRGRVAPVIRAGRK